MGLRVSPELLLNTVLFRGLSREELQDVCKCAREQSLKKSGYFFRQDEPAERIYILLQGKVRITQVSPEGNQVFLRVIGPGDLFGIIAGFSEHAYPASAQSEGAAVAVYWSSKCLLTLMARHPAIGINAVGILSSRIQEIQARFRELATERVERRVARVILRLAAKVGKKLPDGVLIDFKLSRQDLAEMTGTTLFTVSRILNQWEKLGHVRIARQQITVRHPHALVQVAEDLTENSGKP